MADYKETLDAYQQIHDVNKAFDVAATRLQELAHNRVFATCSLVDIIQQARELQFEVNARLANTRAK